MENHIFYCSDVIICIVDIRMINYEGRNVYILYCSPVNKTIFYLYSIITYKF